MEREPSVRAVTSGLRRATQQCVAGGHAGGRGQRHLVRALLRVACSSKTDAAQDIVDGDERCALRVRHRTDGVEGCDDIGFRTRASRRLRLRHGAQSAMTHSAGEYESAL
jgi:hypothetical protein